MRSRFFWKLAKAKMSIKFRSDIVGRVVAVMVFAITPLRAQTLDEKVQVCSGCHGDNGKPVDKTIPIIWGQPTGYL